MSEIAAYGSAGHPPDQPVLTLGDIGVSYQSVFLPSGRFPLAGSSWEVVDNSRTQERIPPWAIVCAIIFFFFCLLGLLFLIVRERQTTGHVSVTAVGNGFAHTTSIRAAGPGTFQQVAQQVNWIRGQANR